MWVKVLPADPTWEPYFREIPNDLEHAWLEIHRIVHGLPEVVKTQTLVNEFGYERETATPKVVMIIQEDGQHGGLPINEKATKYYPNDYDIKIRGDAVLAGWKFYGANGPIGPDIATMPPKWKVIYDMETALNTVEYPGQLRGKLEELLLSVTDPDVRKMYEEARSQMDWRTA